MKETIFGTIRSATDLHLILQRVEVSPAPVKTLFVSIPGRDGDLDLTDALDGVHFGSRVITWTFALRPRADWFEAQRQVSNALNGLKCAITLGDDPDWYYTGRVTVEGFNYTDRALRQITVKATCAPYKLAKTETTVTASLSTTAKTITLANDRMPVIPTITLTCAANLTINGGSYSLSAGTTSLAALRLGEGTTTISAKTTSSTGTITLTYRKGTL